MKELIIASGIKSTPNFAIVDLVHFIDYRDIEQYVYRKFLGEPDTIETRLLINRELNCLENDLKNSGYDITNIHLLSANALTKAEQVYNEKLKKETAKLRHEVSVLQKKLAKIKKVMQ